MPVHAQLTEPSVLKRHRGSISRSGTHGLMLFVSALDNDLDYIKDRVRQSPKVPKVLLYKCATSKETRLTHVDTVLQHADHYGIECFELISGKTIKEAFTCLAKKVLQLNGFCRGPRTLTTPVFLNEPKIVEVEVHRRGVKASWL